MSSCGLQARLRKADQKYQIGEYYAAGDIYRSCYKKVSSKDKKLKGEVIDSWYKVTLTKKFTDEKEPDRSVEISYE